MAGIRSPATAGRDAGIADSAHFVPACHKKQPVEATVTPFEVETAFELESSAPARVVAVRATRVEIDFSETPLPTRSGGYA
jgi:hypothetical protein